MRRWFFPLAVLALVAVVVARHTELDELARTLARGRWPWVVAAAALQGAYYATWAALLTAAFGIVGLPSRVREVLAVLLGSMFANVVAPAGGAAGLLLFMDDAARRGGSAARAAAGLLLTMTAILTALAIVLVGSLAWLSGRHELARVEIGGAVVLVLMIAALGALIGLGLGAPGVLRATLDWIAARLGQAAGAIRRPNPVPADWAAQTAAEFTSAGQGLRGRPGGLLALLGLALVMTVLDVSSLGALFLAFGRLPAPGALVSGYALGILSWLVSPVPQGIGVVEGVMTLVYTSLGVRPETAALVVLSFRGLTFWLPMAVGFVLLRRLRSLRPEAR